MKTLTLSVLLLFLSSPLHAAVIAQKLVEFPRTMADTPQQITIQITNQGEVEAFETRRDGTTIRKNIAALNSEVLQAMASNIRSLQPANLMVIGQAPPTCEDPLRIRYTAIKENAARIELMEIRNCRTYVPQQPLDTPLVSILDGFDYLATLIFE